MDLKQLRTFRAVAELGSLSKAADRLRAAQPALSRHIKLLEHELRAELFTRNGRGMVLTEAGRLLLARTAGIVRQIDQIRDDIQSSGGPPSGRVVLGLVPTVSCVVSARLARRTVESYPGISLCIVESYSGHLIEWLHRGQMDLAVIYGPSVDLHLTVQALGRTGDADPTDHSAVAVEDRRSEEDPYARMLAVNQVMKHEFGTDTGIQPPQPRYKHPARLQGNLSKDIGYYDIGRQDGGDVEGVDTPTEGGSTPFDDPMFKQALEAQGPERRESRSDILKNALAPSYLQDTPSSPQADAALANPFAPAGKIGPPSGPPTTMEQIGGFAADVGSNLVPAGKAAGALKGMFLPAPAYAAERAAKMLKLGQTAREVWDQYGIFQDAAGNWRQEVTGPTRQRIGPEQYKGQPIKSTLAGVVDMPHLYREAPFMERLPMTIAHPQGESESTLGSYDPNSRSFWVRPENKLSYPMRNTIWHETQHAIDHPARMLEHPGGDEEWYEKGMKGLTPDDPLWKFFKGELEKFGHKPTDPLSDPKAPGVRKPIGIPSEHLAAARGATEFQRYRRSVSEVIARNAERREERYNTIRDQQGDEAARRYMQENPPWETEDVARELQITGGRPVRQRGGKVGRALAVARRAA